MEATRSSETSVYNKPTRPHVPEDGILHVYVLLTCGLFNKASNNWYCAEGSGVLGTDADEAAAVPKGQVLSDSLPQWNEQKRSNPQPEHTVSGPRFELGTLHIFPVAYNTVIETRVHWTLITDNT
jgi:hypothetical protein